MIPKTEKQPRDRSQFLSEICLSGIPVAGERKHITKIHEERENAKTHNAVK